MFTHQRAKSVVISGALATDSALQYAAEPAAAVEEAVRAWKQWVTVV